MIYDIPPYDPNAPTHPYVVGSLESLRALDIYFCRIMCNDPTIPNEQTTGWLLEGTILFCESLTTPGLWRWAYQGGFDFETGTHHMLEQCTCSAIEGVHCHEMTWLQQWCPDWCQDPGLWTNNSVTPKPSDDM
jgi:hypothetical protein